MAELSQEREAVTIASDAIEKRLEENGAIEGESRGNGLRITFEAPLAVVFRVDALNRIVYVGQVWEFQ